MDEKSDELDQIIDEIGLKDGTDEVKEADIREQNMISDQQHSSPDQVVNSLQQLLSDFDQATLTELLVKLCRTCGWTTEAITDDSSTVSDIQACRYLPHPESVRLVNHTASRVTVESVNELLAESTQNDQTEYTIVVSESPSDNALEKIQQNNVEVIDLTDLSQEILTRRLVGRVVQHVPEDEQLVAEYDDLLESLNESTNHSVEKEETSSNGAEETGRKTNSSQTSVIGEGDYIAIEVVGFSNEYIEFENRDEDILEDREYTVICLHVENKTAYEWSFRGYDGLAVTSTDGFSYDNPQSNSWSSRNGQFTPWNNGKRHSIKPNSKVRIVVIYKTWFEPDRIEYTADLLHVHGDDDQINGTERISIPIEESTRERIHSLPDSLPIDSVVLN